MPPKRFNAGAEEGKGYVLSLAVGLGMAATTALVASQCAPAVLRDWVGIEMDLRRQTSKNSDATKSSTIFAHALELPDDSVAQSAAAVTKSPYRMLRSADDFVDDGLDAMSSNSISSSTALPKGKGYVATGLKRCGSGGGGGASSFRKHKVGCIPLKTRCSRAVVDIDLHEEVGPWYLKQILNGSAPSEDASLEARAEAAKSHTNSSEAVVAKVVSIMDTMLNLAEKYNKKQRGKSSSGMGSMNAAKDDPQGEERLVEVHQGIATASDRTAQGARFTSIPMSVVDAIDDGSQKGATLKDSLKGLVVDDLRFIWSILKRMEQLVSEYLYCDRIPSAQSTAAMPMCVSEEDRRAAHKKGQSQLYYAPPGFYSSINGSASAHTLPSSYPSSSSTADDAYWPLHIDGVSNNAHAVTAVLFLDSWGGPNPGVAEPSLSGADALKEYAAEVKSNLRGAAAEEQGTASEELLEGGSVEFGLPNNFDLSVEPRRGRLLMYTSGGENTHLITKVSRGVRRALTASFSCDKVLGAQVGRSYEKSHLFKVLDAALHHKPDEVVRPPSEEDEDEPEPKDAPFEDDEVRLSEDGDATNNVPAPRKTYTTSPHPLSDEL